MEENKKKENKIETIVLIIAVFLILFYLKLVLALPNGATITPIKTESLPSGNSTNFSALAGNVTELNIYGDTVTQSWQGYFGNVSGGFQLSDASGNVLYNWTSVTPFGEVYSSKNATIIWTNIQCFNFSATGDYSDDSANRGNTSLYGMNLTQLEAAYNIPPTDTDGVNETFNSKDHQLFYTNNFQFDTGECQNTKILNSSGAGAFEEILLYSPDNREVVFTSIIKHENIGFDEKPHDFEMLVLEDGHGADIQPTPYFFYLELG